MTIKILIFASLSEDIGVSTQSIPASAASTAKQAWEKITDKPLPSHCLVAINQQYAQASDTVAAGDEVAFFPPVTGG